MNPDTVSLVRLHDMEFPKDGSMTGKEQIDALRAGIDPNLLAKYDAMKARFGEKNLVPVKHNSCSACFMALSSIKESQVSNHVVDCDFCGRLIYDPEIIYNSYLV